MSSLTPADTVYLEAILWMDSGYVLKFNDQTFGEAFRRHGIEIHSALYQTYGTSKAKKMRAFWEQEPDQLVGKILSELLDTYEAICVSSDREKDLTALVKCREIVGQVGWTVLQHKFNHQCRFPGEGFRYPRLTEVAS